MTEGKKSSQRLKEMPYSKPDGKGFVVFHRNPESAVSIKEKKSSTLVSYLNSNHDHIIMLLQHTGYRNDKVIEVKFQRIDQGLYQINQREKEVTLFQTSEKLRQTIFDVTNAPEGFLLGFDLQGRRTAMQFLPGISSSTFLQGMHQPFVLYVPNEIIPFPDFNFFMIFDGELIISGSKKLKVVQHTHVFRVSQLELFFGSIKNVSEKFNLRFVMNNEIAMLHSMGDHFHDFNEFYLVLDCLRLKLGVDYFYCSDEFPDRGVVQELSTLVSHEWIGSELGVEGSFIWMK
jgi:hypothetical protein